MHDFIDGRGVHSIGYHSALDAATKHDDAAFVECAISEPDVGHVRKPAVKDIDELIASLKVLRQNVARA